MATPTLRALREHWGSRTAITGVVRPHLAELLDGTFWLDRMILFDPRSGVPAYGTGSLLRQVRSVAPQTAVLLTNGLRSALVTWLAGVRVRVGYARYGRGPLLTHRLYAARDGHRWLPVSAVDYYLKLATFVGVSTYSRQLELAVCSAGQRQADELWAKRKIRDGELIIAMHPGGAYGPAKRWPETYFAELANRLARRHAARVLVLCGPAERVIADRIAKNANHPGVTSVADQPVNLRLTKAVIHRAHLVIATDSGPRHIAAAFRVPTIALFGPTDPRWSLNYQEREIALQTDLACSPCGRRVCPLGHHRCMSDLTVDFVYHVAEHLLATHCVIKGRPGVRHVA